MPTRGELTTGKSISSPHSCSSAQSSHNQPFPSKMHCEQTLVAGLPHSSHKIAGAVFLASTWRHSLSLQLPVLRSLSASIPSSCHNHTHKYRFVLDLRPCPGAHAYFFLPYP